MAGHACICIAIGAAAQGAEYSSGKAWPNRGELELELERQRSFA